MRSAKTVVNVLRLSSSETCKKDPFWPLFLPAPILTSYDTPTDNFGVLSLLIDDPM